MSDEYNFLEDINNITTQKWNQLETYKNIEDQIDKQVDGQARMLLHEARQSKEYMIEFVLTVSEYFDEKDHVDPSPYLHTCKYILNHFDLFEKMDEHLYDSFGEEAYVTSIHETGLEKSEFLEMVETVGLYADEYVQQYYNDIGESGKHIPIQIITQVFHLTLLIMLELENDFVAFFDLSEEQ